MTILIRKQRMFLVWSAIVLVSACTSGQISFPPTGEVLLGETCVSGGDAPTIGQAAILDDGTLVFSYWNSRSRKLNAAEMAELKVFLNSLKPLGVPNGATTYPQRYDHSECQIVLRGEIIARLPPIPQPGTQDQLILILEKIDSLFIEEFGGKYRDYSVIRDKWF